MRTSTRVLGSLLLFLLTVAAFLPGVTVADIKPMWCQIGVYSVPDTEGVACIAAGDLDNDGDNDVATGNDVAVRVYWNDGSGDLSDVDELTGGTYLWAVRLADLDSSGYLDMVFSDDLGEAVYVYRNDSGSFGDIDTIDFYHRVTALEVADYTGDGYPDIVISTDVAGDSFWVYENDGSGNLGSPTAYYHGERRVDFFSTADIDLDGDLDLVAGLGDGETNIAVIENLADTGFQVDSSYLAGSWPVGVKLADYDNDEFPDLVYALASTDSLGIFLNADDSSIHLNASPNKQPNETGYYELVVDVADADNDGNVDILTSYGCYITGTGSSSGSFGAMQQTVPDTSTVIGYACIMTELTGDSYLECLVSSSHRFVVFENCECGIPNTGDVNVSGTITAADVIYLNNYVFSSGPEPLPCVASGDVNCTGSINSSDIIYLNNYVSKSGSAPCDACSLVPDTWTCP